MSRIRFLGVFLLIGAVIFAYQVSSFAVETKEAQSKLLAERAATVDAYRQMAERVMGFQIDSQTYVRDFVAESDQIRTDLDTFIKGVRITNKRFLPDGTCEVDAEITLQELIVELQRIWRYYFDLGRLKKEYDFERILSYSDVKVLKVTGSGVPRPVEQITSQPTSVTTGIPGWENVTPQGRLMAQRAALVDAYRNLAERIMGLKIDAQTYVRDFVAESDQIRTDLDTFIKGIRPSGNYHYTPDGICEIDVEVTIQTIVKELQTIQRRIDHWTHVHFQTINMEKILDINEPRILKATGQGVPPEKYLKRNESVSMPAVAGTPQWIADSIKATGTGIPPQGVAGTEAKLMAERAAKVDAMRNLTELVYGVKIDANTTVRDFMTTSDEVRAAVDTFLVGAAVIDTRYRDDGSVEVDVAIPLEVLWNNVVVKYRR